jgi:hypothetical protein
MTLAAAYDALAVYEALSRVCGDVTGVRVVYGATDGASGSPVVVPIADDLLDTPAILLVPGPWSIIAGSHRRDTHTAQGAIYVPRESPGDGVAKLLQLHGLLAAAFEARSKAYATVPALQSVLLTEGSGLSIAQWPPTETGAVYLTWPFELEVKVNVPGAYVPQ